MTYILTQEQVFNEARVGRNHLNAPLYACIIGGNAHTVTRDESRACAGTYADKNITFPYPEQPYGSLIDLSSVQVFARNIFLKLFSTEDIAPVDAHVERIQCKAQLPDSGCSEGDIVELSSQELNQQFRANVRGAAEAPEHTLLLSRNVPPALLQAEDLELTIFVRCDEIEIAELDYNDGISNFTVDDTGITLHSGLRLLAPPCTNNNGEPVALPVVSADIYIEYRAWLSDLSDRVYAVTTPETIEDIPGELCPANELKWAVELARKNSGLAPVHYVAVSDPDDPAAWDAAVSKLAGNRDFYGVVPLTREPEALSAVLKHVEQQSQPLDGRERKLWVSADVDTMAPVADASNSLDGKPLLACAERVVDDDSYLGLTVDAGNACFVAAGVRPGDIARYNYTEDIYGNEIYDEYVVDNVVHEESLRISTNQGIKPQITPQRIEIWRTRTSDDMVTALSYVANAYSSPRVCAVWPARVQIDGETCEGWHLCAALAGLRSGILPQQDMSNIELVGITGLARVDDLFNGDQLDALANNGVFVVVWDTGVVTPHVAITTARTGNPLVDEEGVVSNLDSINKILKQDMDVFFGRASAAQPTASQLRMRLNQRINILTSTRVHRLGGQVVGGKVETVRRHSFLPGRIVINANIIVPVPGRQGLPPSDREIRRQVIA